MFSGIQVEIPEGLKVNEGQTIRFKLREKHPITKDYLWSIIVKKFWNEYFIQHRALETSQTIKLHPNDSFEPSVSFDVSGYFEYDSNTNLNLSQESEYLSFELDIASSPCCNNINLKYSTKFSADHVLMSPL